MNDDFIDSEKRLLSARSWLNRANKDYRGYVKIVGRQYIKSGRILPEDPSLAIYLLQQSMEKAVKAVAIASGQFDERVFFNREYRHNSMSLFLDITSKLIEIPIVEPALNLIKGQLDEKTQNLLDINDIRARISNIKQNTQIRRSPELPDWIQEFVTLPPQAIRPVIKTLIELRSKLQIALHKTVKTKIIIDTSKVYDYVENPTTEILMSVIEPSFKDNQIHADAVIAIEKLFPIIFGKDIKGMLEKALSTEETKLKKYVVIGQRQNFEDTILAAWGLCSLMFLAAFTFPHESWARYPNSGKTEVELDCTSYGENLGIVSCLKDVGQLTKFTLSDVDLLLDMFSTFFKVYRTGFVPENNQ